MKMKNRYLIIAAVCFFLAGYAAHAQAGPATNVVTLFWKPPPLSYVPFVYEVHQTLSLVTPSWVVLTNVPSTSTNLTLSIDKDFKAWKVRCVNATNSAWFTDFSNTASTLWPGQGGDLGIRLGP